jgi:hypothetical protein
LSIAGLGRPSKVLKPSPLFLIVQTFHGPGYPYIGFCVLHRLIDQPRLVDVGSPRHVGEERGGEERGGERC